MLAELRANYVNAWVLARDLPKIAAGSGDPDVAELCALVQENYGYPVDSVLVSPALEFLGHVNVNEPTAFSPRAYVGFLKRGVALFHGEPVPAQEPAFEEESGSAPPPLLRLTPEKPTASVLDVLRAGAPGEYAIRFHMLDLSAFPRGGTIELHARVGSGAAAGKFELCVPAPDFPDMLTPAKSLARVERDQEGTLTLDFDAGGRFGLAVMAAEGTEAGLTNAFLASVSVRAR